MIRSLWKRHRVVLFLLAPIALLLLPLWLPGWIAAQKRVELVSTKAQWFRDAKTNQPMCRVEMVLEASKFARFRPLWWGPMNMTYGDPIKNPPTIVPPQFSQRSVDFALASRDGMKWNAFVPMKNRTAMSFVCNGERAVLSALFENVNPAPQKDIYAILRINKQKEIENWQPVLQKVSQPIVWQKPPKSPCRIVSDGVEVLTTTIGNVTAGNLTARLKIMHTLTTEQPNHTVVIDDEHIESARGRKFINGKSVFIQELFSEFEDGTSLVTIACDTRTIPASQGRLTLKAKIYCNAYPAQEISAVIRE